MVLVDTSIWIDHLRKGNAQLGALLDEGDVACHPYVIGELACGHIVNRHRILAFLRSLPQAIAAGQDEAMGLIDAHQLQGTGLGFTDVLLLCSARLTSVPIWTLDTSLKKAAAKLGVLFSA
jgi:predicted nucleic acid-binding protein